MSRQNTTRTVSIVCGVLFGVTLGLGLQAGGQAANQGIQGGGNAGPIHEPAFQFTHNDGTKLAVRIDRALFKVPAEYGEPFAVTAAGNQHVVWYRHPTLGVRNVLVAGDRLPIHLLPVVPPVKKLETPQEPSPRTRR